MKRRVPKYRRALGYLAVALAGILVVWVGLLRPVQGPWLITLAVLLVAVGGVAVWLSVPPEERL
jgi:hypothetical protein